MKVIDLLSFVVVWGIEVDEVVILSDEDEEGYIEYFFNFGEFVGLVVVNFI